MIHRVIYGSMERFMAILVEHFGGAFPLWLAPVQAIILTITNRSDDAANELLNKMLSFGIRAQTDIRNEKIGFKIREAQMHKIPYMLILGDREAESGTVSVRTRDGQTIGSMPQDKIIELLQKEADEKALSRNWDL